MTWRALLVLMPLPLLVACLDDKDEDEDDDEGGDDSAASSEPWPGEDDPEAEPDDDEDPDEVDPDDDQLGDLTIAVEWGASSLTLDFGTPVGRTLYLGMAETIDIQDPWTGEDCLYGYALANGDVLGPYCHGIASGWDGIELMYGGDPADLEPGTTVFPDAGWASRVTYMVMNGAQDECVVWGEDPSYFAEMGCREL